MVKRKTKRKTVRKAPVKKKKSIPMSKLTDNQVFALAERNPKYRAEANRRLNKSIKQEVKKAKGVKKLWFRALGYK